MSKIQKYIEDAVKATANEITTKGVEIKDVSVDNKTIVNVDNGDLTSVLQTLAEAQLALANAVVKVSQSKPDIVNNSKALHLEGISNKPMSFLNKGHEDD